METKVCKIICLNTSAVNQNLDYTQIFQDINGFFIPCSDDSKRECREAIKNNISPKHLYIISDDEIQKGDYFLWENCKDNFVKCYYDSNCRDLSLFEGNIYKIIATTDHQLKGLPRLSPDFLKKYIYSLENSFPLSKEVTVQYYNEYHPSPCSKCIHAYTKKEGKHYSINCNALNHGITKCPIIYKVDKDNNIVIIDEINDKNVPIQAIKNCLKYCEEQAIYDKLSKYGDFYYKLKSYIKQNNL